MEQIEREEVQARYPKINFPDPVMEPLWFGRRPTERLDGKFAIIDQNNGTFFNYCTEHYKIVHHEQVLKLVEDVVRSLPEFGNAEIEPTILANGGKLKIKATFKDILYDIKDGDPINPKIEVFSSYDLGWQYRGQFGAYRLVCSNGMTVGKLFSGFKKRHLVSLEPQKLAESITAGMSLFSEQVGLWKQWAEQLITPEYYDATWNNLPFSTAEKEKIENLHEEKTRLLLPDALKKEELTRWDFYNVLTQFVTHEVKSEIRKVELEPIITKVFEN
jgi:hypothetical protein